MNCQSCGVEAPTRRVVFYRNIGALIVRFSKSIDGNLCKSCIHRYFWSFTTTTVLVGWLGVISLIIAPFWILNNVGRYVPCLFMRSRPRGARAPELTGETVQRLAPYTDELVEALSRGEYIEMVINNMAQRAGVTRGQLVFYVQAMVAAAQRERQS